MHSAAKPDTKGEWVIYSSSGELSKLALLAIIISTVLLKSILNFHAHDLSPDFCFVHAK